MHVEHTPPPTPNPHLNNEIGESEVCQNGNYVMHFLYVSLRQSNRVAAVPSLAFDFFKTFQVTDTKTSQLISSDQSRYNL